MVDSRKEKKNSLIIANFSAFYGDRLSAAKEMVQGGPIDVLTGDYLAELTMAILFRDRLRDSKTGYAKTFLKQMEEVMGECLDKNIRVVANAGGLNPRGLARELETLAGSLGLHPKIAYIQGDDLMDRLESLQEKGESFTNMDNGISLKEANARPISANVYFGGWGIAGALAQGADIVVGGRITDASLVVGPAAWWFNWKQNDWDRLAGAVVAGHIIECGPQATGGNYAFFEEVPSYKNIGFPIAEIREDGSFVITKHPHTGGLVSKGTVTAQLLYEIDAPRYLNPDVVARFDSFNISDEGDDRVLITGVRGEPPTGKLKISMNILRGYRNTMTVLLTGLDIEKKAKRIEKDLFDSLGGKDTFAVTKVELIRSEKDNPDNNEEAFAYLRISAMDPDPKKVGRQFSSKIVELVIGHMPGLSFTTPPTNGTTAIAYWPTLVSGSHIQQQVFVGDKQFEVESVPPDSGFELRALEPAAIPAAPGGQLMEVPLGRIFGTRSGDKGANVNLGVWARTPEAFAFLNEFLTVEKLKELLPDLNEFEIARYELPNLWALNFVIKSFLGEGVAASLKMDPQAKTLGEYLRAKIIAVPESIADV
jgi:hypothetical protein